MSTASEETREEEARLARDAIASVSPGSGLVAMLLEVQDRVGWLPRHAIEEVATAMSMAPSDVYSVATFYDRFRLAPHGRCSVSVCKGTACHVKRAGVVMESFERGLGISEGEVTGDGEFGLSSVRCVGCCALAPVAVVDGEVMARMSPSKVDGFLLGRGIRRPGGDGGSR